ncbi:E1 component of the pyruvate dehydrogenase complex [Dirofilaria immitis]|nr:E1 component of the pyruvate dehydrogenase complex [Dirofilaria immitis]
MGFAGIAVGAAFMGLRPVCEMMTFNFSMQCIDHIINSAAKTYYMSAGRVNVPIVFRGPNGPTPGVGAQHTQDFSAWFAFCPGLKVSIPVTSGNAIVDYKRSFDRRIFVMLEDELLYGHAFPVSPEVLSSDFSIPIGKAKIEVPGTDVTIVSYSKAMAQAFDGTEKLAKLGIYAELINLRTLRPLDTECIKNSVKKTRHLITVEAGWPFCNIGAEISAQMVESDVFSHLDAPIQRITGADTPMPYSEAVEAHSMPRGDHVVDAVKKTLNIS